MILVLLNLYYFMVDINQYFVNLNKIYIICIIKYINYNNY